MVELVSCKMSSTIPTNLMKMLSQRRTGGVVVESGVTEGASFEI